MATPNESTPTTADSNPKEARNALDAAVTGTCETLYKLIVTAEEYTQECQQPYFDQINNLVKQLQSMEDKKYDYDVDIPIEIFKFIDNGKNPDLYIKDCLEGCLSTNQRVKGKVKAIENFREELMKEMGSSSS
eukprot:GFYU01007671.1.p1 GENE.GFYU01007671.1~~GFYU01007671.1.p1  ORF type:complete len:133 (+),score=28.72 GFYU01007671.1:65-463(+)